MYSSPAFQRAIARLCTSNKTLNIPKHFFVVYTHFPHRPVTSLPFRLSGDPHAKFFFWWTNPFKTVWPCLLSGHQGSNEAYLDVPEGIYA